MKLPLLMPKFSATMEEGTVVAWIRSSGERVASGDPLLEIETDKATVAIEAPATGTLGVPQVSAGEIAIVGALLVEIETDGPTAGESNAQSTGQISAEPPEQTGAAEQKSNIRVEIPESAHARSDARPAASPAARRLAQQEELELSEIRGTGPEGRIVAADVEAAVQRRRQARPSNPTESIENSNLSDSIRMRRSIAAVVTASHQDIPVFALSRWIDLEAALTQIAEHGGSCRLSDYFLCATVRALAEVRELRTVWNLVQDRPEEIPEANIGLVVATNNGLLIPTIAISAASPLQECSIKRDAAVRAAREGRLGAGQSGRASVALSLMTREAADEFNGIISPNQSGLVAVGRIRESAMVREGQIAIRRGCTTTLSVDHRVVDGRGAARFLGALALAIEEPSFSR
jgi:pyruvate dehydrogenase E2 component (dihydrolipoamide acetyltransferase)